MRGGLVAAGIVFVILGFSWWFALPFLSPLIGDPGMGGAIWLVCILPIVFIIIGFMVFIAGLVGRSDADLAAMRPAAPPQTVYVQTPERSIERPPPPPSQ